MSLYNGYITPVAGSVSATDPVYPSAGGQPVLRAYNPKKYSGKFLRKFYEACILSHISNTEYQGEIKDYGDSVIIRTVPDIQVYDYENGQTIKYEAYGTDYVTLDIDRGKYWAFVTRTVDLKQSDLKSFVEEWTSNAVTRAKIAIEKEVFGEVYVDADSANAGVSAGALSGLWNMGSQTAPRTVSESDIIRFITEAGTVLDEQNIPNEDRWMVVPMWFANMCINSELVKANEMGDDKSLLRKGQDKLGTIDRFEMFRSNCMADGKADVTTPDTVSYTNVIFGNKAALTFAAQLTENETLPNPNGFGKLHRGLTVYGFEVIQPKALGHACLTAATYTA
jgi:hypothetical protein